MACSRYYHPFVTNQPFRLLTRDTFVSFNECQQTIFLNCECACHLCQQKYGVDIKEKASIFEMKEGVGKKTQMLHHQKPDLSLCRVRLPPSHEIVSLICATIWTAKSADESARPIFFPLLKEVSAKLNFSKFDVNRKRVKNIT